MSEIEVGVEASGAQRTDAHPELVGGDVAVAASEAEDGAILARVTFEVASATARSYRSLREAVALLVDIPALGVTASRCLAERERTAPGPNWLGPPAEAGDEGSRRGGWVTATVELAPRPPAGTEVFIRAALRGSVSPACRVVTTGRGPAEPAVEST